MNGYAPIHMWTSDCVHFVRSGDVDSSILATVSHLRQLGISSAYLEYSYGMSTNDIVNAIARQLNLDHQFYGFGAVLPLVSFLDDLAQLSVRAGGVVLVIDNADLLFKEARDEAFDLIEAFLIQFSDWFEKKKPCHLCFQLDSNDFVRKAFSDG